MTLGWLDLELSSHQRGLTAGLSVEDKDKGEGDDDHGTDDTPEGGYVGDEWEIDVHAKKAGDHGEGKQDGVENGEQSHDVVGAVGLQRVEGAGETFDQLAIVFNGVEHLLILV